MVYLVKALSGIYLGAKIVVYYRIVWMYANANYFLKTDHFMDPFVDSTINSQCRIRRLMNF